MKLTQAQFAEGVGLKPANVRDIESGKVKFSTIHALAIENVYQIDSNWLLYGSGDMFVKGKIKEPNAREEFSQDSVEWTKESQDSKDKHKGQRIMSEHQKDQEANEPHSKEKHDSKDISQRVVKIPPLIVDRELLKQVGISVETEITKRKLSVSEEKKWQVISLAYDYLNLRKEGFDQQVVDDYLMLFYPEAD